MTSLRSTPALVSISLLAACSGTMDDGPGGGFGGSAPGAGVGGTPSVAGATFGGTAGTPGVAGSSTGGAPSGGAAPIAGAGGSFGGATPIAGTGGSVVVGGSAGTSTGGTGGSAAGTGGKGGTGGTPSTGGTGGGGNGGTNGTAGSATGGAGTSGGAGSGGSGGNPSTGGKVFSQCRFHFGAIDSFVRNNPSLAAQVDYFIPGWMGTNGDTFDQGYVCQDTNPGRPMAGKIPFVVAYVAGSYAKRHHSPPLNDCNVGSPHLCREGADFIAQNLTNIVNVYRSFAQGYANCYGTTRPIVFMMEPDYYQYTGSGQVDPWTFQEAGQYMSQFVGAIRQFLPNAVFSMDISPWVGSNGADHGAQWYSNFDMSLFTFVNTSGGRTEAANTRIRQANQMTWAGVRQASGKPILADSGYTANGASTGHDTAWDSVANVNARIANGVVAMAQYNPNSGWGSTLSSIRGQLSAPTVCP